MLRPSLTVYFLRFALASSLLSAVADRFGLWGLPGTPNVAWGSFANFTAYTGSLNPFVPNTFIPTLAWAATLLEILLGVLLFAGIKLRETALATSALLFLFALAMTFAVSPKAPLDYSVFSASAAALALAKLSASRR